MQNPTPTENKKSANHKTQNFGATSSKGSLTIEKMSDSEDGSVHTPPIAPSRKRKRDLTIVELEVDINAPVPPSKKALRRAKKAKPNSHTSPKANQTNVSNPREERKAPATTVDPARCTEFGIWIGNLPWSATKLDVKTFITSNTDVADGEIIRLHMPSPRGGAVNTSSRPHAPKPQNKGFAYVDFSTAAALAKALQLTETLLVGRRVLIKDSKSFEGRPEKQPANDGDATAGAVDGKPASKRIFIGNLGFDTTEEDLREHFTRCGQVSNVHVATFEDSGKCKGYAWVEFEELAAGEAAVRGWVDFEEEEEGDGDEDEEIKKALAKGDDYDHHDDDDDGGDETATGEDNKHPKSKKSQKKQKKPRKWWVNKLKGRLLRMEFAENKAVRYKKRYGKDGSNAKKVQVVEEGISITADHQIETRTTTTSKNTTQREDPVPPPPPHARKKVMAIAASKRGNVVIAKSKKVDARTIKPGAALAAAPRLTAGGVVQFKGKKILLAS